MSVTFAISIVYFALYFFSIFTFFLWNFVYVIWCCILALAVCWFFVCELVIFIIVPFKFIQWKLRCCWINPVCFGEFSLITLLFLNWFFRACPSKSTKDQIFAFLIIFLLISKSGFLFFINTYNSIINLSILNLHCIFTHNIQNFIIFDLVISFQVLLLLVFMSAWLIFCAFYFKWFGIHL